MSLTPVAELITEIRDGRMIILMDDEDRENEGDLVIAAEAVTPDIINFFAREACGLICLTITQERAQQLKLPLMVRDNRSQHETNFTVSIDAAERVGPGISAVQRSLTVQRAIAVDAGPEDIVQPGHIFPLVARSGGVLRRAGHTEAGTDLARMAGLQPASLIVEIMNEDGTMARRPELEAFAAKHGIKMGTIADLIAYRALHEHSVELRDSRTVETGYGRFTLHTFIDLIEDSVHYALSMGVLEPHLDTLVRVQTLNTLRDVFDTRLPDAAPGWSLGRALQAIAQRGHGVLVLIDPAATAEQRLLQVQQFPPAGHAARGDAGNRIYRLIGTGSQILRRIGVQRMVLMSAPIHFNALSGFNLEVTDFLECPGV